MPGAGSAGAYVLEGEKWANGTTHFSYVVPNKSAAYSTAFKQAMARWNTVTPFKFVPVDQSSKPCNFSGPNGVSFGLSACGQAFGSTTLAVTTYSYSAGKFIHVGTVFNSHKAFSIYTGSLRAPSTDFRRVAVHELGHGLGLDHEKNSGIPAIMSPTVSNIEKPTADDIAGVNALY